MMNPNNNTIPANYRSNVYCTAIREGSEKEYNFAAVQYSKETDANTKNTIQAGLACSRIPWIISKFLSDQIDTNVVRIQDALSGLRAVATRAESNLKTWIFIKDNWELLFAR
jgi:aminopeptidase N